VHLGEGLEGIGMQGVFACTSRHCISKEHPALARILDVGRSTRAATMTACDDDGWSHNGTRRTFLAMERRGGNSKNGGGD
jgi:hypothetical protein